MAKNLDKYVTWALLAAVIFLLATMKPTQIIWKDGGTYITNTTIIEELEAPNATIADCYQEINPTRIGEGESIAFMIRDGLNTHCDFYGNLNETGWMLYWFGNTSVFGDLTHTETFWLAGNYAFRTICGTCITNPSYLEVEAPPVASPTASPTPLGGYTCGLNGQDAQCGGTCPSNYPYCLSVSVGSDPQTGYEACVCADSNSGSGNIAPDWRIGGSMHHPILSANLPSGNCFDADAHLNGATQIKTFSYCDDEFGRHFDYCGGTYQIKDWYCANKADGSGQYCSDGKTTSCSFYGDVGLTCSNGWCG